MRADFGLWNLLRADFCSWNWLHDGFSPRETDFVNETYCLLIFAPGIFWVLIIFRETSHLVFNRKACCMLIFLFVKMILFIELVVCWFFFMQLVASWFLFIKLFACWYFLFVKFVFWFFSPQNWSYSLNLLRGLLRADFVSELVVCLFLSWNFWHTMWLWFWKMLICSFVILENWFFSSWN